MQLRVEPRTYKVAGGKVVDNERAGDPVDVNLISSNFHLEMNPSEIGPFKDRLLTQAVVKEIAQSHVVGAATVPFKVIVLNEVDRLSRDGQAALRRTMEKYTASCRFVLVCSNACRVMEPVRSRCVCFRVPAPSQEQLVEVLGAVARDQKLELPAPLAARIATESQGNMRRALLTLEACRVRQSGNSLPEGMEIEKPDWERFLAAIAASMMEEQSPTRLLKIRGQIYELLTNCIPPDVIIKQLVLELLKKCDDSLKPDIIKWAAFYEARLHHGSKPIFHIEAFIARFMAMFKKELLAMFDD